MTTRFKFYYEEAGGHTHVRFFAGSNRPGATLAKAGDFVLRNEEWVDFMDSAEHSLIEFVDEGKRTAFSDYKEDK